MNAAPVIRSGHERRQRNIFFVAETRRMGTDRRHHGPTADEAYDALWASTKSFWKRVFGAH